MTIDKRKKIVVTTLTCVILVASGFEAVYLGQDIGWDVLDYHYYNGYAFVNSRYDFDVAPAQLQTYLSPYLDVFHYAIISSMPPVIGGFLLGVIHGINILLIFLLSLYFFRKRRFYISCFISLIIALTGMLGAAYVREVGGFFGDTFISFFILTALYLCLRNKDSRNTPCVVGALLGIASGLKLTALFYAPGFLFIYLFRFYKTKHLRDPACFLIAFLSLFSLIALPWMLTMYRQYGNPLFPFSIQGVQNFSLMVTNDPFTQFRPQGIIDFFLYPFQFIRQSANFDLVDYRFPVLAVVICAYLLGVFFIRKRIIFDNQTENANLIVFYVVFTFFLSELSFGVHRYLVVLELLAPLVIVLCVSRFLYKWNTAIILTAIAMSVFFSFMTYPGFIKRMEWTSSYYEIYTDTSQYANTQILLVGFAPIGYSIPSFPPSTQFIRLQGNFYDAFQNDWTLFTDTIKHTLQQKKIKYLMYSSREFAFPDEQQLKLMNIFGLDVDRSLCEILPTKIEALVICPAYALR